MSFLRRVLQYVQRPPRYVGSDLAGNKFFEGASAHGDPRRTKRTVEYADKDNMWEYVGGGKRLAIQWSSWLSHTRADPPTLQELQADYERQRLVLERAAAIEQKYREEREAIEAMRQAAAIPGPSEPEPVVESTPESRPPASESSVRKEKKMKDKEADPWGHLTAPGSYEPESWTPKATKRRR